MEIEICSVKQIIHLFSINFSTNNISKDTKIQSQCTNYLFLDELDYGEMGWTLRRFWRYIGYWNYFL